MATPPLVVEDPLRDALLASQRLGMLGRRSIDEVIAHADAFVDALATTSGRIVDLGSGGGVPGLVIAVARPDLQVELLDRRAARTDHLLRLVRRLGLDGRVTVTCADATRLDVRTDVDAVVARGFGPPAVVATTAARFLRDGGLLVVSEPPLGGDDRWSDVTGLDRVPGSDPRVAVLRRVPRGTIDRSDPGGST